MVINSYLGAWLEYGGHHGVGDVVQVVRRVQAAPPCPLRVLVRLRNKNCVSLTSMCKKSIFLNCLSNKSSFLFHLRNKSSTLMKLRRLSDSKVCQETDYLGGKIPFYNFATNENCE